MHLHLREPHDISFRTIPGKGCNSWSDGVCKTLTDERVCQLFSKTQTIVIIHTYMCHHPRIPPHDGLRQYSFVYHMRLKCRPWLWGLNTNDPVLEFMRNSLPYLWFYLRAENRHDNSKCDLCVVRIMMRHTTEHINAEGRAAASRSWAEISMERKNGYLSQAYHGGLVTKFRIVGKLGVQVYDTVNCSSNVLIATLSYRTKGC